MSWKRLKKIDELSLNCHPTSSQRNAVFAGSVGFAGGADFSEFRGLLVGQWLDGWFSGGGAALDSWEIARAGGDRASFAFARVLGKDGGGVANGTCSPDGWG